MSFNSDEVNQLVYRYLEESGYRHSAFTFGYESNVLNAGLDSTTIPRGALMTLIQKGVLFAEAEVFSLLNDGELDARFEKAIGCMGIFECVMCDAAKTKAILKRMGIQRSHNVPMDDQQRTPSRVTTSGIDQNQSAQLHQAHGLTPSRPESTSSTKSSNAAFQQQQQQQIHRDREFRAQQTGHAGNSLPARGTYNRTNQNDRLLVENTGMKCNPTLASTSSGQTSITNTTNHLHPNTNSATMGMHHPFYHQQTFGKPISMGHADASGAFLTSNITNGGGNGNPINGPTSQSMHQQINPASAFPSLTSLQGINNINQTTAADITRLLLNGSTSYSNSSAGLGTKRGTGNG